MKIPSTSVLIVSGLVLASASGFLTSQAISAAGDPPARTVTVNLTSGPPGPAGPAGATGPPGPSGPRGPAGSVSCPAAYSAGKLVINHPGGQTAIWTCIEE